MPDIADVSTPCLAYNDMCQAWDLIHDLLGGTRAMRRASTKWLPQEPKELDKNYNMRLGRSFLFGKYKNTVKELGEKPFSREVTLKESDSLHEQLQGIENDADREKNNITVFAQQAFQYGINYGKHHILVDHPSVPEGTNLDAQRKLDLRPYFVNVPSPNLIGWKSELAPGGGGRVLTEIRIKECAIVEGGDDQYEQKKVDRVRVYRRDAWFLYESQEDSTSKKQTWVKIAEGKNTLGRIPLVTFYFDTEATFMQATPVLEDLAWMNCAHWQSQSDQRNILRVARLPIQFIKGFSKEELDSLVVSVATALKTTNKDADAKYIEHSGAAIEAGRNDLKDLEAAMDVLALQPELENAPQKTATGEVISNSKSETSLQSWVRREQHALEECYRIAAEWVNTELPEKFGVQIYSDFAIGGRSLQEIDRLLTMRRDRQITQRKLLLESKRRSLLTEDTDIEVEISGTQDEAGILVGEDDPAGGNANGNQREDQ